MKRWLILTEAGDSIGMGHLTRCQAIFEELGRAEAELQSQMFVDVHGAFKISGPGVRALIGARTSPRSQKWVTILTLS